MTRNLNVGFLVALVGMIGTPEFVRAEFHQVDVFLGGATQSVSTRGTNQGALALGLKYELRLPSSDELIGLGLTSDFVFFNQTETILALIVLLHPYKELAISLGPGFSLNTPGTRTLLRVGTSWSFEIGDYFLSPRLDLNLIARNRNGFEFDDINQSFVFGAFLGKRF